MRVVQENLESAVALGFEKENASAVIKAFEKKAGVEVKARRPFVRLPFSQKRSRHTSRPVSYSNPGAMAS